MGRNTPGTGGAAGCGADGSGTAGLGQQPAGQEPTPERDRVPGRTAAQHHRQGVETGAAGAVLGEAGLSPPLPPGGAGGEGLGLSDCSETTYGPDSSRPLPNPLPSWERAPDSQTALRPLTG